ncbi:MAG: ATP-binding protein, partial [Candidatus Cloacimonadaceae bacterium]|nr:ATP-binding protein [Candidatus Cloacimonadaceae bacterium]
FQSDDDIEQVDINSTISESLIIFEAAIKKAGIAIKTSLCHNRALVMGNRFKLEQVLFNLLSNAKDTISEKHQLTGISPDQAIEVSSECRAESVFIRIKDCGMGISAEVLDKIFDPFYTSKSPDKGTGLGLAISYGIINDMGGSIMVESELGIGSTFVISLPLIRLELCIN